MDYEETIEIAKEWLGERTDFDKKEMSYCKMDGRNIYKLATALIEMAGEVEKYKIIWSYEEGVVIRKLQSELTALKAENERLISELKHNQVMDHQYWEQKKALKSATDVIRFYGLECKHEMAHNGMNSFIMDQGKRAREWLAGNEKGDGK